APEWTNHNESDPGIAMLQLFAWMTDLTLYRLNRVPERNYIKFLQLLGIELKPAQPATADLTFTLSRDDLDSVIVPKGTQVAGGSDDDGPILFETDEALVALGAKLTAVQTHDSFSYSVVTNQNAAAGQHYYPFGVYAREGSALLLGFDSPVAFTNQQVNLAVRVHDAAKTDSHNCDLDTAVLPPPATLAWEYWNGKEWRPLSLDKDETQAFTVNGHVYFKGPGKEIKKAAVGDVPTSLYWLRCRLLKNYYETSPQLEMVLTNTVTATQAITLTDEVLGGSNGRPAQTFTLATTPLVPLARSETVTGADGRSVTVSTLKLEVDEGSGFQTWQQVDDFFASGPDDPHFTLQPTTGAVTFGDGLNGRIPTANPANPNGNIVARLYRSGGGTRGNVGADAIADIQNFVQYVDSVTNLFPAAGGSDEESVDAAKQRAPYEIKSRDRAVTSEDFEFFAIQTPGVRVRRAKVQPLVHPQFPGVTIPGVVTVIVVPESDDPRPMPSPRTVTAVCQCLNQHRLLTTEVYVVPPVYRKVKIEAQLIARPQADLAEVKQAVESALTTLFHPLRGGDDGLGWEFGRTIFYSEVYRIILQVSGVDRIDNNQLVIWLDDEAQPFCRDVPLDPGDLLYSDAHDITVAYAR
ncbi:MAG: putative baseplate assembly protein, partial [Anaerolineales bacterium]|nr:putative baseplate assembly protein [Anaerolineales bacterium]